MADLNVEVVRTATGAIVRVGGDLDKLTAPALGRRLDELLAEDCVDIVVDTQELEFCDSSGLWVLIEHQRTVRARGGSLTLTGVHGVLRRVLDITGLAVTFQPDLEVGNLGPGGVPRQTP